MARQDCFIGIDLGSTTTKALILDALSRRRCYATTDHNVKVEFSADGRHLLVVKFRSIADADLLLVDCRTGERRQLTPAEGKGSVRAAAFSADGKSVYFQSNESYKNPGPVMQIGYSAAGTSMTLKIGPLS